MATIRTTYKYKVDMDKGTFEITLRNALMQSDALADAFEITVQRNGQDVDISGMNVYGYLYASATKTTALLKGTVSGNKATVVLTEECYAVPGYASLAIQLHDGDVRHTVLKVDFVVTRTGGNIVLDGGNVLPTLAELLNKISAMEQATRAANTAAATATEAAASVEAFKGEIQGDLTALTEDIGNLDASKDYKDLLDGYLHIDGRFRAVDGWKVTDYIPFAAPTVRASFFAVAMESEKYYNVWAYDADKNPISGVCRFDVAQSVDDEFALPDGTAYIRYMITEYTYNQYPDFRFGYDVGATLIEAMPKLKETQTTAKQTETVASGLLTMLDAFKNIADPNGLLTGGVWSGVNTFYVAENWCRQEIVVKPNTQYTVDNITPAFSWFTNDNLENLGNISGTRFTTPEGCTRVRLGKSGNAPFVLLDTDYSGTVNATLFPYGVYKKKDEYITLPQNMTTVALFERIGVCGNSFSSGGIYGIEGAAEGKHYGISWPKIMGRKNGIECIPYAVPGRNSETWQTHESCLPALLSDEPCNLYIVMLGINQEPALGTIADINEDYTQNPNTFYGNMGKIYETIKAHAPSAKFIFVTPPLGPDRWAAIQEIAEHYNVPWFATTDDPFYMTDLYKDNQGMGHPVAVTYAGMALAMERQIAACMCDNISYFLDYTGND